MRFLSAFSEKHVCSNNDLIENGFLTFFFFFLNLAAIFIGTCDYHRNGICSLKDDKLFLRAVLFPFFSMGALLTMAHT